MITVLFAFEHLLGSRTGGMQTPIGEFRDARLPTIACEHYDRVQAIRDGRVEVAGCEVNFMELGSEECSSARCATRSSTSASCR